MFNFIIQLLVLSGINTLSAGEIFTEFHVNETNLQQPRDYPCPDAADIAPCVCSYASWSDSLYLNCTEISSDEELANILAKDFPVNEFFQFSIYSSTSLTALNFTCGGVKFQQFFLYPGPFPSLVEVTDDFYLSCASSDLEYVYFKYTQLSSVVFPPPPLNDKITNFYMAYSNLTSVSAISSDSLSKLYLTDAQVSELTSGIFDAIPNMEYLYLYNNNIKIMKNGSIPIMTNGYEYFFEFNGLATIEPGAFTLKGEPSLNSLVIYLHDNLLKTIDASVFEFLMPYIYRLDIYDNPLDCDCDLAWIITNPEHLAKVKHGAASCADGTLLTELDPLTYEQYC